MYHFLLIFTFLYKNKCEKIKNRNYFFFFFFFFFFYRNHLIIDEKMKGHLGESAAPKVEQTDKKGKGQKEENKEKKRGKRGKKEKLKKNKRRERGWGVLRGTQRTE